MDLKSPGAGLLRAQNSLISAIPLKTEIKKVENKFNHQSIIQDKFNSQFEPGFGNVVCLRALSGSYSN